MSLCGGLKIAQLLGKLQNIEWDVVLLSGTRTFAGKYRLDGGHILFTALSENNFSGTRILLHSKYVKKLNKIHSINDRVLVFDFTAYGIKMRTVAVYAPHAGNPKQDFDDTFDQLRYVLQQGKNLKRRLVVGGDFNYQLDNSVRGVALRNLSNACGLNITNERTNEWENDWTFCNSMGITRKTDFVMASRSLIVKNSSASIDIDMGCDHRAVKTRFDMNGVRYWEKTKRMRMNRTNTKFGPRWSAVN